MFEFLKKESKKIDVTFATSVWENDYTFLEDRAYLHKKIIHHCHLFTRKILIINNVKDPDYVKKLADERVKDGFFTDVFFAKDYEKEVLEFFELKREDFKSDRPDVSDDWVFYNALGPLTAIYLSSTPYLLYCTGDVYLNEKIMWIPKAILMMEKNKNYKVANLTWNDKFDEAKKESYRAKTGFFVAKEGFSDQLFLVRSEDFRAPIYSEIREDSHHFPRGSVFEKRVFSYMKNHGWKRLTYQKASYVHEDYQPLVTR